jgi:hypothetical protein
MTSTEANSANRRLPSHPRSICLLQAEGSCQNWNIHGRKAGVEVATLALGHRRYEG